MWRRQLGTELYFDELPFVRWRGLTFHNGQEGIIEFSGWDSVGSVFIYGDSSFYSFEDSLFVKGRDKYNRDVFKWSCFLIYLFFKKFGGFGFLFNKIPFVYQNDYAFVVSVGQPKNILNLTVKTSGRIDQ